MSVLVMGVSGSGKSTIGAALAVELGIDFVDADALHPLTNIDKMAAGIPLDDHDRDPWLAAVARTLADREVVLACSALKRRYRDRLRAAQPLLELVYVHADATTIRERLLAREGHFMTAALLESQMNTLEAPTPDEHPIGLDSSLPSAVLVRTAVAELRRHRQPVNPSEHQTPVRNPHV